MFRIWGKIWKDNHMIRDTVVSDDSNDNRTKKVLRCLASICYEFDLENPIWLNVNISQFQRSSRTRFTQDSFVEQISFDNLEIQVIEE